MTYYIHDIPGRLRIRSPAVKDNDLAKREIPGLLGSFSGIESIVVNTATGSFLIRYDPSRVSGRDIMAMLTEHGYFDPREATTNDEYLRNASAKAFSMVLTLLFPLMVGE